MCLVQCRYSDTTIHVNLALMQLTSMSTELGLPSPVTILFNRPVGGMLSGINRSPMICNYNGVHNNALKGRKN